MFCNVRHRPLDVQLFNAWSKRIGQIFVCFFFLFSNIFFSNFYQRIHNYIHIYFYRVIYLCDIYHIYIIIIIAYVYHIVYYNYLNSNRAHRRKYKALSNLFILSLCICVLSSFPFHLFLFPFKLLFCCATHR